MQFYASGYNTFILTYSVKEQTRSVNPLSQLASAVVQIHKKEEEWYTIPSQIEVCGFFAGGHLTASLGVLCNKTEFLEVFPCTDNIRPDAMILCYPVITADEFAHVQSIENVSGEKKEANDINGLV